MTKSKYVQAICTYCMTEARVGTYVRRRGEVLCATCYDKAADGPTTEARRTQQSYKNLAESWATAVKQRQQELAEVEAPQKIAQKVETKMVMVDEGAPNLDDIEIPNFDE
jgi:uncharacterized Zn finger protein (UPF0148 family)